MSMSLVTARGKPSVFPKRTQDAPKRERNLGRTAIEEITGFFPITSGGGGETLAPISDHLGGGSSNNGSFRDILGDDGPCTDNSSVTN